MDLSKAYLHTLGGDEEAKLGDLRGRIPAVIAKARQESADVPADGKVSLWRVGIESKSDAADMVLLKYLRAEDLDVEKAAERIAQTLVFRADCCIDGLMESELPEHFRGHDSITGKDPSGRPIMVSRFGGMVIDKVFGDAEAFVRYRVKIMEQAIAQLSFQRGAAEDLCQIHDYSGVMSSMFNSDVKGCVTAVSKVFEQHYPEFKGVTLFVNFPAVFSKPFQAFISFLPERTRKKFAILGQSDQLALFDYVGPECVPQSLGGMLQDPAGPLRGPCKVVVISARGEEVVDMLSVPGPADILWELRACTLEVGYEVVFAPAGGGEEEVIQKTEPNQYLQAEDGVALGEWHAKAAGTVKCRFRNERAWFKKRVCVCRAEEGVRPK